MKQLFIMVENDGEAVETIHLLQKNNAHILLSAQTWGASWEGLEESIKVTIANAVESGVTVYGFELQGQTPKGCLNIDHHNYHWANDNRTNSKSSLEQVADLLGQTLTRHQRLVALNDSGYIPSMKEFGATEEEIACVRLQDRRAQGITKQHEQEAEEAISKKEKVNNLYLVRCMHSKSATITDRLFGQYENLVIFSSDGETNFFGQREMIDWLSHQFPNSWSDDKTQKSGFWGSSVENQKDIEEALRARFK